MIWPMGIVSFHWSLEVKERVASLPSCSFSLFVFSSCADRQIWSLFKINFQPLFKLLEKHGGFLSFFSKIYVDWSKTEPRKRTISFANSPKKEKKEEKKRETEITQLCFIAGVE